MVNPEPVEIRDSLKRFRRDYPESRVAFIMMQFGQTGAHRDISKAIRATLGSYGVVGVRADDKDYHDDLFPNIQTYLYACDFGIAVFERLESEDFNPNVSLEVGCLMGLGKPVCLLKDKTLRLLHTDLVGKLYKSFDPQDPSSSIPPVLTQWLLDHELVSRLEDDPLYNYLLLITESRDRKHAVRKQILQLLAATDGYLARSAIERRLGLHGDYGSGAVRPLSLLQGQGAVSYKENPPTFGLYGLTNRARRILENLRREKL